jgi:hypothetical protein
MRPSKLPIALIAPLALSALAVAGCGGGGDDSTAAATTRETAAALTKAELVARGDSICGEVNAAVGSAGSSEAETPQETIQVSGLYVGMVESLKSLGAPEEPAGYSEFIAAAEELSKVEGEAKLAAEREDGAALGEAASRAGPALEDFQRAASEYGFEQCGESPSAPTGAGSAVPPGEEEAAEEGGVEVAPEEFEEEEAPVEEVVPEEAAPETGGAGGAGGGVEEAAPETGGGSGGGSSGGVGPG